MTSAFLGHVSQDLIKYCQVQRWIGGFDIDSHQSLHVGDIQVVLMIHQWADLRPRCLLGKSLQVLIKAPHRMACILLGETKTWTGMPIEHKYEATQSCALVGLVNLSYWKAMTVRGSGKIPPSFGNLRAFSRRHEKV
jgi:hypothetical protein